MPSVAAIPCQFEHPMPVATSTPTAPAVFDGATQDVKSGAMPPKSRRSANGPACLRRFDQRAMVSVD